MKTVSASLETVIGFALNCTSMRVQGTDAASIAIGLLRPGVDPAGARRSTGAGAPVISQPQRVAA